MDIRIENVHKTFYPNTNRSHDALIDINLTIHKGDFITIVGGNGAGKSTFLNAISGSFPLDKGHLYMGEAAVEHTAEYERAKYISRVYQNPLQGTAPRMTVAENLSLALRRGLKRGLKKGYTAEELEQFKALLTPLQLGLEERLDAEIGLLSGGQRQAVSLLMATLRTPELLLLDEHTAALDPKTQRKIMQLTKEIIEEKQLTALMITHNLSDALRYGNRLMMMHRGKIIRVFEKDEKDALTEEKLYQLMAELDEADFNQEA